MAAAVSGFIILVSVQQNESPLSMRLIEADTTLHKLVIDRMSLRTASSVLRTAYCVLAKPIALLSPPAPT